MRWFWDFLIEPLLDTLELDHVAEIGAGAGATTAKLLDLVARRDAVAHVIDPDPRFDVAVLEERYGRHLHFHRASSFRVLRTLPPLTAALIDGDHNWYTVVHELKAIDEAARRARRPFPLVMLHDVAWPYGRRDMYHEPGAIPPEFRQPWKRQPIMWGRSTLSDARGINPNFANAVSEGGERNGVLTALEDFIAETPIALAVHMVEGDAGLAIVASRDLLHTSPRLQEKWDHIGSAEFLHEHTRRLAREATEAQVARHDAVQQLRTSR